MNRRGRHILKRFLCIGWAGITIVAFGVYSLQGVLHMPVAAAQESAWLTAPPILETLRDPVLATDLPYRTGGNRDCQQRTSVTRPKRVTIVWPFVQSEQTKSACAVDTTYGSIDEQGYLQRSGTNIAGIVKDQTGAQAVVVAVPRSSDLLVLDKSAPGQTVYLHLYRNARESLKTTVSLDGSVAHQLTQPPTVSLRDAQQKLVGVQFESAAFSANGRWLVVDIPGTGLSRIDLTTMSITPFVRWPIGYDSGSSPSYQTAVGGKGRYTVVGSAEYRILKLFDTQTCTKPILAMYESCQSLDLQSYMTNHIAGFVGVSRIRFVDEDAIDFYATRKVGGDIVYGHYLLHLPQYTSNAGYLGLGDSFSSGEGAYAYKNGTDIHENKCHLSLQSYPFVLGSELGLSEYQSVACSGAMINDFIYPDQRVYNTNLSQASGKTDDSFDTEIYTGYLPGYRTQKNFVDRDKPAVITLTAGGNDIGFSDIIKRCVGPDTCYQYREEREQLRNLIDSQFTHLVDLYRQVYQASGVDRTRVYVVGYPEVAQPEGNCAANVHLNKGELYFANELVDYLDDVIKQAAAAAGVYYVDVSQALAGHRFCETDSWNVALNGLTGGNDMPAVLGYSMGPIANESFHPNQLGQWLLADSIRKQTQDLTIAMPAASPGLQLDDQHDQLPILENAPSLGPTEATVARAEFYREGPAVMSKDQPTTLTVAADTYSLQPLSTVDISLRSEPIHIATAQTDAAGSITVAATVPNTVPNGYHTLHIRAENIAGEAVDLFKTVLVTGSQHAIAADQCVAVPNAGVDQDHDGTDDACDAVIGTPVAIRAALLTTQQTMKPDGNHTMLSDSAQPNQYAPTPAGASRAAMSNDRAVQPHILGSRFIAVSANKLPAKATGKWIMLISVLSVTTVVLINRKRRKAG